MPWGRIPQQTEGHRGGIGATRKAIGTQQVNCPVWYPITGRNREFCPLVSPMPLPMRLIGAMAMAYATMAMIYGEVVVQYDYHI
jgi:hypothetical protein